MTFSFNSDGCFTVTPAVICLKLPPPADGKCLGRSEGCPCALALSHAEEASVSDVHQQPRGTAACPLNCFAPLYWVEGETKMPLRAAAGVSTDPHLPWHVGTLVVRIKKSRNTNLQISSVA